MKIFSDKSYLPAGQGHVVMLYPFWGKNPEDTRDPSSGRFDKYAQMGSRFFQMAPLPEADIAVLPMEWEPTLKSSEAMDLAMQFIEDVGKVGRQVIIFFWSDSDKKVPIENAVVFRTSFYRSKRKPNEFAMPAWSEDLVKKYLGGQLPIREKRTRPIVRFCGYAAPLKVPFKRRMKDILRWGASLMGIREKLSKTGLVIRGKALSILAKSPLVNTNFIIRDHLAGAVLPDGREHVALRQKVRLEYVQNMIEGDYILCPRGLEISPIGCMRL